MMVTMFVQTWLNRNEERQLNARGEAQKRVVDVEALRRGLNSLQQGLALVIKAHFVVVALGQASHRLVRGGGED